MSIDVPFNVQLRLLALCMYKNCRICGNRKQVWIGRVRGKPLLCL